MTQLFCDTCRSTFAYDPLWSNCPHCGASLSVNNYNESFEDLQRRVELLEELLIQHDLEEEG